MAKPPGGRTFWGWSGKGDFPPAGTAGEVYPPGVHTGAAGPAELRSIDASLLTAV